MSLIFELLAPNLPKLCSIFLAYSRPTTHIVMELPGGIQPPALNDWG